MAVFRDIEFIKFPTALDIIPGCQEVSVECSGDEIEHSACDDDAISYRGLTGLVCDADLSIEGGADFLRDVFGVVFGAAIPDVMSAELSEVSSELVDSADADLWVTVVGVTERAVEASITARSADTIAGLTLGDVDTLTIKAKTGSLTTGLTGAGEEVFTALSMELVNFGPTAKHADFAEASAEFKSTAGVKTFTGGEMAGIHPGDSGTLIFKIKPADAGVAKTFTLVNAIVMERSASLSQGEMVSESLTVKAFSTDGTTEPLSVA